MGRSAPEQALNEMELWQGEVVVLMPWSLVVS